MHAAYMQKHMFVIVIVFVAARNLSLSLSLSLSLPTSDSSFLSFCLSLPQHTCKRIYGLPVFSGGRLKLNLGEEASPGYPCTR
jgi:uncharacterized membrane protein YkgB